MIACRSGKTLTSKGVSVFLLGAPGMNTKDCIQKAEEIKFRRADIFYSVFCKLQDNEVQ